MAEHGGISILQGSEHHDDMFVVAISPTNIMCEFNITLEKIHKNKREVDEDGEEVTNISTPMTTRNDTGFIFDKRYHKLMETFAYKIDGKVCINLNEVLSTEIKPKHLMFYMSRGDRFYIISDYSGHLNIFNRGLTFRSRFYTGEDEIVQLMKKSLTIVVVHKHDIKFVKFYTSSMGNKRCHSGLSEISEIQIDSNFHGLIYASTTSGEILVFKTEKLLQNVDTIS